MTETINAPAVTLRLRKGTPEWHALIAAWNQGIDAHLTAICHSKVEDCGGVLQVDLDPRDLPVLMRRLTELGQEQRAEKHGPFEAIWTGAAALLITLKKRSALPEMTPFLRSYIQAALWNSSCNETVNDDRPMDEHYGPEDLALKTLETMARDCAFFLEKHADDIAAGDCKRTAGNYTSEERAAHDLWLTRVGAGVGFWDGDWSEPHATRMTETCKEMPHVETLYLGNDKKIYQM